MENRINALEAKEMNYIPKMKESLRKKKLNQAKDYFLKAI